MNVNELYVNKYTLNSAHIYFDSSKKAKHFRDVLTKNNVRFVTFIWKMGEFEYYGFRMLRMRYQFMQVMRGLKDVLEDAC